MAECNIRIFYLGGLFTVDGVEGTAEEIADYYGSIINNKKDRCLAIESPNNTVVFNVNNIINFEITPVKPKTEREG